MLNWIETLRAYFADGRCRNNTAEPVDACTPDGLVRLPPGDGLPHGVICHGIVLPDGSVVGMAGWHSGWPTTDRAELPRLIRLSNVSVGGLWTETLTPGLIAYGVRCESLGASPLVPGGWYAGTRGRALRVEALRIEALSDEVELRYAARFDDAETTWVPGGTPLRGQRLEGFAAELARGGDRYELHYMGHVEWDGDTDWHRGGDYCGTRDGRRMEGLAIVVTEKGMDPASVAARLGGIEHFPAEITGSPL